MNPIECHHHLLTT